MTYFTDAEVEEYLRELFGEDMESLIKALRTPMQYYAVRVDDPDDVCRVLTTIRNDGFEAQRHSFLPDVVLVETRTRDECSDLDATSEARRCSKHVIADKTAAESVMCGADLYLPGVEKADTSEPGDAVCVLGPNGVIVGIGEACVPLRGKPPRGEQGVAIRTYWSPFMTPSLRRMGLIDDGTARGQSLTSCLVSHVVDPQPGETVLDACAAPGNKTTHIAALSKQQADVIAVDRSKPRFKRLHANIDRSGSKNVRTINGDVVQLAQSMQLPEADKILVDPPCTAIGVRPKLNDETSLREVHSLAQYQKGIMHAVSHLLKPGGRLVYSTCTLSTEENESVIEFAVQRLGLKVEKRPFQCGSPGLSKHCLSFDPDDVLRFHPHVHGTSGFFIASLRRPDDDQSV